ncbi:MAG: FIST C-terminal domain-containing protein [Deltaproteobacteria bacterium]|nr:FIST C-terminal domain-containing protein [Deltaproteobacteria bacterium]
MPGAAAHFAEILHEEQLAALLRRWRTEHPRMAVLALLPEGERGGIERLQAACRREAVPLAGAVFPALLARGGFATSGAWLLRLDEAPPTALLADLPREERDLRAIAGSLVDRLEPGLSGSTDLTLLLIPDATFPRVGSLLDELYLRLGNRVHYMGASAGSETFQPIPCLFDGTRAVQGGVLAVLLPGDRRAVLDHGYPTPSRLITATTTVGNRIIQIDWRPAFEVYRTMSRLLHGVDVTPETFYRFAVHFPFGILLANNSMLIRIPVELEAGGALRCAGEVPANSVLALLAAPTHGSAETVERLAGGLAEPGGSVEGKELLFFYCAGRRLTFGEAEAVRETEALRRLTAAGAIAGALSLGEIGGTAESSYPLFHNATLLASVWKAR